MGQGFISKQILRDIADFIRKRKGTTADIKPVDMAAELESIPTFEDGKQAEYDRFWDNLQKNGAKISYSYAFYSDMWSDDNYNPKYDIDCSGLATHSIFYANKITDTKVTIICRGTTLNTTFTSAYILKSVRRMVVDETTKYNRVFEGCSALENIIIEGTVGQNGLNLQWSTKLSHDSLVSIMNCLSTTTSGLSVTLSSTAVNNAFTAEEWTALEQTRPNWTISLV